VYRLNIKSQTDHSQDTFKIPWQFVALVTAIRVTCICLYQSFKYNISDFNIQTLLITGMGMDQMRSQLHSVGQQGFPQDFPVSFQILWHC